MVKQFKKSSTPEPIDRWPRNSCASTTKIVEIMTLRWPLHNRSTLVIEANVEKNEMILFMETIATFVLKMVEAFY